MRANGILNVEKGGFRVLTPFTYTGTFRSWWLVQGLVVVKYEE